MNSLLDAFPETPATIWFETANDDELPFRTSQRHDLRLVPRADDGESLVSRVRKELPDLAKRPAEIYFWIACEAGSTRALTAFARKELGDPQGPHALHGLLAGLTVGRRLWRRRRCRPCASRRRRP